MHPEFKGLLIAVGLVLAALSLKGCATRNIPIVKQGELAKVKSETVEPARRPPERAPADTPQGEVAKQWGKDRKNWADEADRGDTARCILCAERGNKIISKKTGENTCRKLKCWTVPRERHSPFSAYPPMSAGSRQVWSRARAFFVSAIQHMDVCRS